MYPIDKVSEEKNPLFLHLSSGPHKKETFSRRPRILHNAVQDSAQSFLQSEEELNQGEIIAVTGRQQSLVIVTSPPNGGVKSVPEVTKIYLNMRGRCFNTPN